MTYTPISRGTQDWDTPVNAAFTDHETRITTNESSITTQTGQISALTTRVGQVESSVMKASTAGWLAMNYDPLSVQGTSSLSTGVLFMVRVDLASAATIATLYYSLNAAGSTLTSGQNLVGLYDSSGNLLAQTADQSSNWTSTGLKVTPLTVSANVAAGTYYLGFLSNGTTPIGLVRSSAMSSQTAAVNLNLSNATARWATTGSGLTALPSTITMSGRSQSFGTVWAAIG